MKGRIVNFRMGRHHHSPNQMVVEVAGTDSKEKAQSLVGKKVVWTTPGKKEMTGKVSAPHGAGGAVRVIFETGMPGQSIGQEVDIQ